MTRFSDQPSTNSEPIYNGGPVEGPLLVTHDRADGAEADDFEF